MRFFASSLKSGWKWWWGFGLLIAVPALALGLLGLRAVRAERIEREQQTREQQKQVARLIDAAVSNSLAEVEGALRRIGTSDDANTQSEIARNEQALAGGIIFSLNPQGILLFSHDKIYVGERPAFLTSQTEWQLRTEQLIDRAQAAEAQGRMGEAATLYHQIISVEPKLRAWAEISRARTRQQSGDAQALAKLPVPAWSRSEDLTPTGLPAVLLACVYAERLAEQERTHFIPLLEQTLESLRAGRWWLSHDERRFYDAELRRLLNLSGSNKSFRDDMRLEEITGVEQAIRQTFSLQRGVGTRSYERTARGSFLILWSQASRESEIWAGIAFSQHVLAELFESTITPLVSQQPFSAAIRDTHGALIWGSTSNVSHAETLRAVSGLEVAFNNPVVAGWMNQRQWLWYGFIMLLVLMLMAGLAMTARTVRREVELGRMQNEFIAAVSHEFKSPLTSIRLLMERITAGRSTKPESTREYYAAIGRETVRLERLVNRLLEAQQIQTGRKRYDFAPVSLLELIHDAVTDLRPQAEAKNIRLEMRAEDEIPQLSLDHAAITDALENLIDNAIKYSSSGTRVTVAVSKLDHQVCVEVSDEGIGIGADELSRIFDKFYRGQRSDMQNVRGTGLGLTLVKAAVEAHGGTITVSSEPGRGCRFTLRLPAQNGEGNHAASSDS